jgi:hypothetical protein
MDEAKKRARAYRQLASFIVSNGAWPVSLPGTSPLRFEAVSSSPISDMLREDGHQVTRVGESERCTGNAGPQKTRDAVWYYAGIVKTQVFELTLDGSYAPSPWKHDALTVTSSTQM